ncbi:MAG: ribosome biogenesis GTPase Der [Phycisphaerales bacterium]
MPLPLIAIVGRPNVGKSSLLNMLAARKVSIVDDTPGTTRDRVSTVIHLEGPDTAKPPIDAELTDTGGYGVYTVEGRRIDDAGNDLAALTADIEGQIGRAVERADLVLFVIDSQAGLTAQDWEVAKLLREGGLGERKKAKTGKARRHAGTKAQSSAGTENGKAGAARSEGSGAKVIVVANKCDGPKWESHALEAAALGFGEPILVGAHNNYKRRDFVEELYERCRKLKKPKAAKKPDFPEMLLAIVGKRNAGKSTLVNALAGEERVIVSEIPGTTRDAVDVRFEIDGRSMLAIDTAGLRKKKSFQDRIEWWAFDRCQRAVERADVCALLIDATEPVSQVDQHLGSLIAKQFKPAVIVVNKWDLAVGRPQAWVKPDKKGRVPKVTAEAYEEYLRKELNGLDFAPVALISAKEGTNIRETIDLAFELFAQSRTRVTTGKLNRLLREIIRTQGPSSKLGTFAKVLFVSQVTVTPPTIVCVVNKPQLFTANYQRFLMNRFREELPFAEVPIKLIIRARRQDEVIETQDGQLARVRDSTGKARGGPLVEVTDADAAALFDEPVRRKGPKGP